MLLSILGEVTDILGEVVELQETHIYLSCRLRWSLQNTMRLTPCIVNNDNHQSHFSIGSETIWTLRQ